MKQANLSTSPRIRAIETRYRGYRFRSRLEARWAVFFDTLGVPYDYEPEGYALPSGPYLPDFFLPRAANRGMWVEVKPADPQLLEGSKLSELCDHTTRYGFFVCGVPSPHLRADMIHKEGGALHSCWDEFVEMMLINDKNKTRDVGRALVAARGARFEHGEQP
jgi:hypothetical protein